MINKITHESNANLRNWDFTHPSFEPDERILPIAGLLKYPKYAWSTATWDTAPAYVHEHMTGAVLKTGNGLLVLDFDIKPDGNGMDQFLEFFKEEKEMISEMRESALVHTPTGGTHSYFTLPENVRIKSVAGIHEKMPHVDTRSEGGLIVLPGSQVPNVEIEGLSPHRYNASNGAIKPIPEKLLKFLIEDCQLEYTSKKKKVKNDSVKNDSNSSRTVSNSISEKEVTDIEAYITQAIEAQQNEIMGSSARNDQLNKSAYSLAKILTENEVFEALEATALASGLEPGEVESTIRSAVNAQNEFITLIEKNKNKNEDYQKEVKDMSYLTEFDDLLNFDIDDIVNVKQSVKSEEDIIDDTVQSVQSVQEENLKTEEEIVVIEKKGLTEKAAREKILRENQLDMLSLARFWESKVKESGYLKMAESGELYRVNDNSIYTRDALYERWVKETKKKLISKVEKVAEMNNIFLDDILVKIESNSFLKDAYSVGKVDVFSIEETFDRTDCFVDSNGNVISLKNGKVRKATPEDLVLNSANAEYVGRYDQLDDMGYSKEKAILEELLTALTAETREYFQAVAGSGLSSKPPHEGKIYFNYSTGGSGKTTIMNFISETLGNDYGARADNSILSFNAHEEYLADLRGARLTYIEEAPGAIIDVSQLKKIVDSGALKTRKMFQGTENTQITWTFFVNTNNLPRVQAHEVNTALQRRMVIIPWNKKYSGTPQDKVYFKDLHKSERMRSVMLSWLVEGAITWFSNDKIEGNLPEEIREITENWFETAKSNNPLTSFVTEMLETSKDHYILTEEIFAVFQEYCKRANFQYKKSRLAFSKELVQYIEGIEVGSVRPAGREWDTLSGEKNIDPQNRLNKILNVKFAI